MVCERQAVYIEIHAAFSFIHRGVDNLGLPGLSLVTRFGAALGGAVNVGVAGRTYAKGATPAAIGRVSACVQTAPVTGAFDA